MGPGRSWPRRRSSSGLTCRVHHPGRPGSQDLGAGRRRGGAARPPRQGSADARHQPQQWARGVGAGRRQRPEIRSRRVLGAGLAARTTPDGAPGPGVSKPEDAQRRWAKARTATWSAVANWVMTRSFKPVEQGAECQTSRCRRQAGGSESARARKNPVRNKGKPSISIDTSENPILHCSMNLTQALPRKGN